MLFLPRDYSSFRIMSLYYLKCVSASMHFQLGEGPSRAFLHDFKTSNFTKVRFKLYCSQLAHYTRYMELYICTPVFNETDPECDCVSCMDDGRCLHVWLQCAPAVLCSAVSRHRL